MLDLSTPIARIATLLEQDSAQSVTYAALEARLTLERICYDRLRQRHDYISNHDLTRWPPHHVINTIINEIDPYVSQSMTISVCSHDREDATDDDFVTIGTEIGIDPKKISKLWNALSNLALHVSVPVDRDDMVSDYGNKESITEKVHEALLEIKRISQGKLTFSGVGPEVSFECLCGQKILRKAHLLKQGQIISCFNYTCSRSYKVEIDLEGSLNFQLDALEIPCSACKEITLAPRRGLMRMKFDESMIIKCLKCSNETPVVWLLAAKGRQ